MYYRRLILSIFLLFAFLPLLQPRSGVAGASSEAPLANADWWATAQENIRQQEYHITWQERTELPLIDMGGAYQAPNRANNLRTYFTEAGIVVIPRHAPTWEWGLTLTHYGYEGALQSVTAAELEITDNRISYQRGNVTEWYINDKRGLEQGFTITSPPSKGRTLKGLSSRQSPLVLELDVSGDLIPNLNADRQAIDFMSASGETVLRYDTLIVVDATGKVLPAQMGVVGCGTDEGCQVQLVVNDASAVYPIIIDPLATSPNWTAESDQAEALFGHSVGTAGDVNNDGYDDIIVALYTYDNGQTDEGAAFVYHGSSTGLSTTPNWTAESDQIEARFGSSVGSAGDVNGDGYDDVIVGAIWYTNGQTDEGGAFVYHGSATGLSSTPDWTVDSNQSYSLFGRSVGTAGDVNNDGYDDVIVGAPRYDNGEDDEGQVYVYHGSSSGLSLTPNWTVEGNQARANLGTSVGTAGDVNGDDYADVIIGAWGYNNSEFDEGAAFVYQGSSTGLSLNPSWQVEGDQAGATLGISVGTAGDVNKDGYADVIVGAPAYDNGEQTEGKSFVYHGSSTGLSSTADWSAEGELDGAALGSSVATAGDINNDGYSDVIIGARQYSNGEEKEGKVFVYLGTATGLNSTADWTAESDQENARFGMSIGTAGDVNGDGYDDIVVGADHYDNGQTDEGAAFVYHGQAPDPPDSLCKVYQNGDAPDSKCDINGGGYSGDGYITGTGGDSDTITNYINANGSGSVPPAPSELDMSGDDFVSPIAVLTIINFVNNPHFYQNPNNHCDVNGDGMVSALDGEILTDRLGSPDYRVAFYDVNGDGNLDTSDVDEVHNCPDIDVSPSSFSITLAEGQSSSEALSINNRGTGNLDWSINPDPDNAWLNATPTSGVLTSNGSQNVTIGFDATNLTVGTYNGTLTISSNDPNQPSIEVPITLIVEADDVLYGDCNADATVNAGDLSALVLEIFNPGQFGNSGCDSNQDSGVNAGDLSCTVLIIFNAPGACSGSQVRSTGGQIVWAMPAEYQTAFSLAIAALLKLWGHTRLSFRAQRGISSARTRFLAALG